MAGAADLHRHPHGEFGGIDDGGPFFENFGLWQGCVPGTLAVAGFAGNTGLNKSILLQTASSILPRCIPIGLVVLSGPI
jgi:hypothetical protein